MSSNIDAMSVYRLRDALAVAAGWELTDGREISIPGREVVGGVWVNNSLGKWSSSHPIPPLDSPATLGVVAGMMPKGFSERAERSNPSDLKTWNGNWSAWAWYGYADTYRKYPTHYAWGCTETIARARLVLKVLAATRKEGGAVMDCLVDGCDCQDDKGKT